VDSPAHLCCQTLGVSRTPVREALLKLERDNLIVRDGPAAEAHWRSHLQRGGDELAEHVAVSETSEF